MVKTIEFIFLLGLIPLSTGDWRINKNDFRNFFLSVKFNTFSKKMFSTLTLGYTKLIQNL